MSELLQKRIRACLSRTFFYGSDLEEENLREALARHAQCREEDEIDLSVATTGVKEALAARTSFEEYSAFDATIDRAFRDFHGQFKDSPAHIITVELVAGLNPPEFETKVATALDMKGCWKAHPDLVYSVAREAAERLGRLLSRPISSAAFNLVQKVLSCEWSVPRRKKDQ